MNPATGFAALCLAACGLLCAQEATPAAKPSAAPAPAAVPAPETLMDKFVELTGGPQNHRKVKTEVTEGTLEMAAQGVKGKLTIYRADPDKMSTVMEIEAVGKIEEVVNGKYSWERSALQGARLKEGEELDVALRSAAADSVIDWRKYYPKIEPAGIDKVDGASCNTVRLTPATGKPETRCFDQKSGLMVKLAMVVKSPMGELPIESYFGDYRKEGDLLVAHKIVQKAMGAEIVMTLEKVTYNPPIPPEIFAMPDDVKALVEKARTAAPPPAAKPEGAPEVKPEPKKQP